MLNNLGTKNILILKIKIFIIKNYINKLII